MDKDKQPVLGISGEEKDKFWNDLYIKEKGEIVEFDSNKKSGKVRSLVNEELYEIDSEELAKTKIELKIGDKVLFAPFEDPDGQDHAIVVKVL